MRSKLRIEADLSGHAPCVSLIGDFDSWHIDDFDAAIRDVLATGPVQCLVLDLTRLDFLSSMGLSGLLRARSLIDDVTLLGCHPRVRRTLEIAGLSDFFTFKEPDPRPEDE